MTTRWKMARKSGKKQKENPLGCIEEGKGWKGNIREGSGEGKDWNRLGVVFAVNWYT